MPPTMESSYPSEKDRKTAEQVLYYLHRAERIPVKEDDPYAHLPLMPGTPPPPQRRASTPPNFDTDTESDIAADIERRRKAVHDYDPGTESESSSSSDGDGDDGDELPSYARSTRRPLPSSSSKSSTLSNEDKGKGRAIDIPVYSSQFHVAETERQSEDEEENTDSQKTVLASQAELQTSSARPFCPDCLYALAQTSPSATPSPACTCGPCLSTDRQHRPQACLCLYNRSQIILLLSDLAAALSSAFLHKPSATHGQRHIYSLVVSTLNSIQSNPRKAVAEFYGKERFRDWACYVDFWAAKNEDITDAWMELQWATFEDGEGLEMLTHRNTGGRGRGRKRD